MQKTQHNSIRNHSSKPKWDWMQVDCNLKTQNNRKYAIWSLAPSIVLTNPSAEGPDPNVKLYIDTEKSLQFSQQLGWNWHKSWNLPNISIRVEIKDVSTGQSLLAPKNLYAQLFAVKVVVDPHQKNQNAHLVDVGIRGTSKIQMVDGQAYFTAMKFLSTSYNNEGVKFYLLLVIYINNSQSEIPKILTATLSPPIFVDSRKSARDNQQKKYSSFIEPFLVQNVQKQFIKRQNKRKNENQIKIRNDFQGLFNYLTAPNIRHKVKHPIFLIIKFNNCSKLYFNSNLIAKNTTINQVLNILQKKISKDHTSKRSSKSQNKIDDKMFILLIKQSFDSFKNKKVQESIDPLDCNSLGIIYNQQQLPPFFQNISVFGNISNAYKQEYSQLYLIAKSIINISNSDGENSQQQQSQSQNQSSQEQSESPLPVRKVRFHKKYQSDPEDDFQQKQQQISSNKKQINNQQNESNNLLKKNSIPSVPLANKQPNSSQNIPINNNLAINQTIQNSNTPNQQIPNPTIPPVASSQTNNNTNNNNTNNVPNNIQQLLMNNMNLSSTLNSIKMNNIYGNNSQQNSLLGLLGASSNNLGKGLNIPGLNPPQTQQNDLLSSLLGNNNFNNTLGNLNALSSLGGLFGLNSQISNQLNNPINNPSLNLLSNQNHQQSTQKIGFSPTVQSQSQSQTQTQPQPQQQQQVQQNPLGLNLNLNSNPQQTNLLLLQQLAMYKQLLNQLTFQSQIGMNMNLGSMLSGLGQGMGQGGLGQSLSQNLSQSLGQTLAPGLNGLNLNSLGSGFNNFGFFQNQQLPQQQNLLKMMQQLQNNMGQKQAKQQEQ